MARFAILGLLALTLAVPAAVFADSGAGEPTEPAGSDDASASGSEAPEPESAPRHDVSDPPDKADDEVADDAPEDGEKTVEPPADDAEKKDGWKHSEEGKALIQRADRIIEATSKVRGVAPTGPIEKGLMMRDELREMLLKKIEEEQSEEDVEAETKLLRRLAIIAPDLDYEAFILELLTEQIAGFYDDETGELYIMEGQDPEFVDTVMSHELFHALQDQHWTIGTIRGPEDANADFQLARVALIEGDATAVMMDFELDPMSFTDVPGLEGLIRGSASLSFGGTGSVMDNAPLAIQESLVFPYIEGLFFVAHIKKRGGWKAVDAVYADPPDSTEQILHPERYVNRDDPVAVDFSVPTATTNTWRELYDDVMGELGLLLYLRQHLAEHEEDVDLARVAAAGWDGDRARLYEDPNGNLLLVNLVVMDEEQDADELVDALETVADLRFANARVQRLDSGDGTGAILTADGETTWIEQRGTHVLYIEGLRSEGEATRDLVETIWLTKSSRPYAIETVAADGSDRPSSETSVDTRDGDR